MDMLFRIIKFQTRQFRATRLGQNNFDLEVDVDKLAAIAELSSNGGRRKIRLHDKLKALELLGKHLGMFGPKAPEVSPGFEIDAETIRARMLAKLRQAQEASRNTSGGPPQSPEASEASL